MSPRAGQNGERITAYLSNELLKLLKSEAKEKGISVSVLVRMILHEHANKKKNG